jgi:hypothetical protein
MKRPQHETEAEVDKSQAVRPPAELQGLSPRPRSFQPYLVPPIPKPLLPVILRKRTIGSEVETDADELDDVRPTKMPRRLPPAGHNYLEGCTQHLLKVEAHRRGELESYEQTERVDDVGVSELRTSSCCSLVVS